MEKVLMCPRTEICPVYKIYADNTKNYELGVIKVVPMESTDFYSCKALRVVKKLEKDGTLPETLAERLRTVDDCLMIDQANNLVIKHRHDL